MMRHVIEGEANEKPVRLGSSIYPGSLNHKTCQSHSLILYQMVEFFRFIIQKTALIQKSKLRKYCFWLIMQLMAYHCCFPRTTRKVGWKKEKKKGSIWWRWRAPKTARFGNLRFRKKGSSLRWAQCFLGCFFLRTCAETQVKLDKMDKPKKLTEEGHLEAEKLAEILTRSWG